MIGLFLGIFLLLMCIIMLIFGTGSLGGFLGVGFVFILSLWLIFYELKKKVNDKKTSVQGEKCYARILDCVKTGTFILNKEKYKVITAVYVPSLQKKLILEEIVGFNNFEQYPKDSFFSVLYYNNDINVKEGLNESEIPNEILKVLKDEVVLNEYGKYKKENQEMYQVAMEEKIQKVTSIMEKVQLIYKRIILGIIMIILLIMILFETAVVKQTIIAKDYVETIATYVDKKISDENSIFDDYIYTFEDKNGIKQEIIVSISKDEIAESEIKIKYDENNPKEYYEEGMTYDNSGVIWYIVKIIAMILLMILFFNKKLLNKIHISATKN